MSAIITRTETAVTTTRKRAGTAIAALLAADALAHAFWATGATWPADSTATLSQGLLNADVPFTPRVLLPLCALLTTAAVGVFAHSRGRGGRLTALVTGAVAAGFAVRGAVGVVWVLGIGADTGSTFYRLNLLVYTPICLGFGYAAARLARAGLARTPGRIIRARATGR
ncbi:DUF3995 domain-containing protein [Embleya sp. NBC_00896]|uniref:DUF3995 domain-containing protein n=1 Tax=Embleya sp. NBC_00896 TaxID=2975961 RepID=UPI002F90909E|nr:DUF3995 domain-containing protein [Embleya sp. NBC_00896]